MPKKSPEARLYGREFQQRNATAAKPTTGWLRNLMSSQKPPEQKLYGSRFQERGR